MQVPEQQSAAFVQIPLRRQPQIPSIKQVPDAQSLPIVHGMWYVCLHCPASQTPSQHWASLPQAALVAPQQV